MHIAPMLPRGSGPLVSVLICSRGRPQHLPLAIRSLLEKAYNPHQVEILVKVDDDDQETLQAVDRISKEVPIKAAVSPRGRGYADIHHFTNLLASHATGDWLFIFNDDARMKTSGWDLCLERFVGPSLWHYSPEDVLVLTSCVNGQADSNEFIFVRRSLFSILGHLSLCPYMDSWLYSVTQYIQALVRFHVIEVEHLREVVRDQTRASTDDFSVNGFATLEGIGPALGQLSDTMRILSHLQVKTQMVPIQDEPTEAGWWYWQEDLDSRPHHVYVNQNKEMWPIEREGGMWRLRFKVDA